MGEAPQAVATDDPGAIGPDDLVPDGTGPDGTGPGGTGLDDAGGPAEAEATRERLIDATIELLKENGNHALRLADVARETGVAVSTIYAHFRDRTDLVAAARLQQFKSHAEDALRSVDEHIDHTVDLDGLVRAALWPSLRNPEEGASRVRRWDRVEAIADARHIPELAAELEQLQSTLTRRTADMTRRAQEAGLVDPTLDPRAVGLLTQVLRLGLTLWDLSGDEKPSPEAWAELLDRIGSSLLVERPADDKAS